MIDTKPKYLNNSQLIIQICLCFWFLLLTKSLLSQNPTRENSLEVYGSINYNHLGFSYENVSMDFQEIYEERFKRAFGYSAGISYRFNRNTWSQLIGLRFSNHRINFDTKNVTSTTIQDLSYISQRFSLHDISLPVGLERSIFKGNAGIYFGTGINFGAQLITRTTYYNLEENVLFEEKQKFGLDDRLGKINFLLDLLFTVKLSEKHKRLSLCAGYNGFILPEHVFSDSNIKNFQHNFVMGLKITPLMRRN